ncbi:MAG: PilW family protein [Methylophilaceae bacterium]
MYIKTLNDNKQSGFTLIELMVGLVIGLIATIVIMQTFSVFEGQKRTTVGTADAQVNGSIALNNIQRHVQMAGFGLPIFDATTNKNNSPLKCSPSVIDHDVDNATPDVDLFPIAITDGGAGANSSDQITVRYFPGEGGGLPVDVTNVAGTVLTVPNNMGCANGDLALLVQGTTCNVGRVTTTDAALAAAPTSLTLTGDDVANMATSIDPNLYARLSCLGPTLNSITYRINNNELENNNAPVIADIVHMQAQYGVTASATSNQITSWVEPTGIWAAPTVANRNRIRAVRVSVVARNGLQEKTNVSTACSSTTAANPTGVCAWDATSASPIIASPAPTINLTGTANWQRYRYRVYQTIIPLRNLTWSGAWL